MKVKHIIFSVLIALLLAITTSFAVSTREIERVRNKGVLGDEDFEVIENFVAQAVKELIETRDFTSVARKRTVILSNDNSNKSSAQAQYSEHFFEAVHKSIGRGFELAAGMADKQRSFKVTLNLLILLDGLGDLRLADMAIGKLGDANKAIAYWAVHSLTNDKIAEKLNSTEPEELKKGQKIIDKLGDMIDKAEPEVLGLIVKFADRLNIEQGTELLVKIADMRIKKYAGWNVDNELLDAAILKSLYDKMQSSIDWKAAIAGRFGKLYSYAMQRYIADINGGDFLTDEQKGYLASVLVEIENRCISRIMGIRQSVIKKAVEKKDFRALLEEHKRLFGDKSSTGQLILKLGLEGEDVSGPFLLPVRPK